MASFLFYERNTGATAFSFDSDAGGNLSVEKAGRLLAVFCLMKCRKPEDFSLMRPVCDSVLRGTLRNAEELMRESRESVAGVKISRREREVLGWIIKGMTNKEISSSLNISVRTVKFHVTSLLQKFGVQGRSALSIIGGLT